jgi:hypothetical protein
VLLSMTSLTTLALTSEVECSKYSPERFSQECQERGDFAAGLFFVIAIASLAVGWLWWRYKMKRVDEAAERDRAPDE